jgi:hypothetical protein
VEGEYDVLERGVRHGVAMCCACDSGLGTIVVYAKEFVAATQM